MVSCNFVLFFDRAGQIKKADVLIIDEIGMLSSKIFHAVHCVASFVRKTKEAFGGLQTIFVGDFKVSYLWCHQFRDCASMLPMTHPGKKVGNLSIWNNLHLLLSIFEL